MSEARERYRAQEAELNQFVAHAIRQMRQAQEAEVVRMLNARALYRCVPQTHWPRLLRIKQRLRYWEQRYLKFGWFKNWLHKDCDR